ncbi:MAG: hypothetical protein AAFN07_09590 [Pseudomonadota bacterium]
MDKDYAISRTLALSLAIPLFLLGALFALFALNGLTKAMLLLPLTFEAFGQGNYAGAGAMSSGFFSAAILGGLAYITFKYARRLWAKPQWAIDAEAAEARAKVSD